MALAGGSSLLIAGDALRAWGDTQLDEPPSIIGMPKAVKVYKEDVNAGRRKTAKVDKTRVLNSVRFRERLATGKSRTQTRQPLLVLLFRLHHRAV